MRRGARGEAPRRSLRTTPQHRSTDPGGDEHRARQARRGTHALHSDTGLGLVEELGPPTFEAGGLTLFRRLTLVVREGVIEHVLYSIFSPNERAEEVLAWLRAAE